jgi:hypothetical protein
MQIASPIFGELKVTGPHLVRPYTRREAPYQQHQQCSA